MGNDIAMGDPCKKHRKFDEDRTWSSEDRPEDRQTYMQTHRQTHKQTKHTDTLITILCSLLGAERLKTVVMCFVLGTPI